MALTWFVGNPGSGSPHSRGLDTIGTGNSEQERSPEGREEALNGNLSLRFHCQPAILLMERWTTEKLSVTIGVVQSGTLRYEDQQHRTAAVGMPS